jgi:hypothetical protein
LTGHFPHLTAAKYNTDSEGGFMIIRVEMERFTISRRQIRGLGIFAGVTVGVGVVLLVVSVFAPTHTFVARAALSLGIFTLVGGLLFAFLSLGYKSTYTEISADGVRTKSQFSDKNVAWQNVKDIKVDRADKRDWHRIVLVCRNGQTITLSAPVESPILVPDPEFNTKVERVITAWRQMTVAPGN